MKKNRKSSVAKPEHTEVKVHPWRVCPVGQHAVRTHPLHKSPSETSPQGSVTTRHFHCANNPSGKDVLNPLEIEAIAEDKFSQLNGSPCSLPLDFDNGSDFDDLIRGWVKYWNEVINPQNALDPNMVKALIASESGFDPETGAKKKGKNIARRLMQITPQTVRALADEKGELKDHYVAVKGKELLDPNLNICAGVRWLFQKQVMASHRLGKAASWEEAVEDYKGALKDRLAGKKVNSTVMGNFKKHLEIYKKCGKKK